MEYHIEYVPTARFLTDTTRREWLRKSWTSYILWLGLPLLTLCMCLASPEMTASRQGIFCSGMFLGAVLMVVIQFFAHLFNIPKSAEKMIRQRKGGPVSIGFDEEGITYSYNGANVRYPWKNIVALWQQPRGWLLYYAEERFIVLPFELLNTELRQFIVSKITEVSGKIHR